MRDVRHDNLAQFMGACVDSPNICILFQYGPKGSLQVIHLAPLNAMALSHICAPMRMRTANCWSMKLQPWAAVSSWLEHVSMT